MSEGGLELTSPHTAYGGLKRQGPAFSGFWRERDPLAAARCRSTTLAAISKPLAKRDPSADPFKDSLHPPECDEPGVANLGTAALSTSPAEVQRG